MIQSKKFILFSLALPIVALAGLALQRSMNLSSGREVTLPISGYDPRDLLSGHYLIYAIDYNTPKLCSDLSEVTGTYYVCPAESRFDARKPSNCSYYIKGICRGGRFEAGIEKFFIPESSAVRLNNLVADKRGAVVLSVQPDGEAQVKDLLIEGKPWKEFLDSENDTNSEDDNDSEDDLDR